MRHKYGCLHLQFFLRQQSAERSLFSLRCETQEFNSINLFLMRAQIQRNYEDFFPNQVPLLRSIFTKHPSRSRQRAPVVSRTAAQHQTENVTPGRAHPKSSAISPHFTSSKSPLGRQPSASAPLGVTLLLPGACPKRTPVLGLCSEIPSCHMQVQYPFRKSFSHPLTPTYK